MKWSSKRDDNMPSRPESPTSFDQVISIYQEEDVTITFVEDDISEPRLPEFQIHM